MKHYLIALLGTLFVTLSANASEEYYEAYNLALNSLNDDFHDLGIIRPINGGTVILPEFEDGCPEELINAFSYACKILEEYMPTSLPIKVLVKTHNGGVNGNLISTINFRIQSFRDYQQTIPMTTVKAVIYGEWAYHTVSYTYLDSVPSVASLIEKPDISISYNADKFSDISFSLDPTPGDKYDFVSLVLRDLFIGFGFSSNFRGDVTSEVLRNPISQMNEFEKLIYNALGSSNSRRRFEAATQGELTICDGENGPELKLYAPKAWDQTHSLRFTIPSEQTSISQIMSHTFGKGTVSRGLNDKHSEFLFCTLFKWFYDFTSGGGNIGIPQESSTENIIPYNPGVNKMTSKESQLLNTNTNNDLDSIARHQEVVDYVNTFLPFFGPMVSTGVSVSLLKKDGSWDLVYSVPFYEGENYYHNEGLDMSNWVLHCKDSDYARSPDGHLRVRHAIAKREYSTIYPEQIIVKPKYYVADYLPQQILLKGKKKTTIVIDKPFPALANGGNSEASLLATREPLPNYRLYFKNLEGVERVVVEYLKDGTRLPIKYPVSDFKKGYYDLNVGMTGQITAVSYNSNGYKRSEPLIITRSDINILQTSISNTNAKISISSNEDNPLYEYSINGLDASNSSININGITDRSIDISDLRAGLYAVQIHCISNNERVTYKFAKH